MKRIRGLGLAGLMGIAAASGLLMGACNTDDSVGGTGPSDTVDAAVDQTTPVVTDASDASIDVQVDRATPIEAAADVSVDVRVIPVDAGPDVFDSGDAKVEAAVDSGTDASDATVIDAADADAADADAEVEADVVDTGADVVDEGDAAPESPTLALVTRVLGQACADAAQGPLYGCFLPGNGFLCEEASGSSDAGTRESLCLSTLQCSLSTQCGLDTSSIFTCYCGTFSSVDCPANPATGACAMAEETGLETTDPATIVGRAYSAPATGGGIANNLSQCLAGVPECQP